MSAPRHLRGSTLYCPRCASSKVAYHAEARFKGYGPGLATCRNCKALWEAFEPSQIWDPSDPRASFKDPCNNCAFRPGSPEQADPVKWRGLLDHLKCGGRFYCHKGVPIDADAEHGFAYPEKPVVIEVDGVEAVKNIGDHKKLRLCRGYLNASVALFRAYEREAKAGTLNPLEIVGDAALPLSGSAELQAAIANLGVRP